MNLSLILATALAATPLVTIPAPEARQGAAVDTRFAYAIDDSRIAKYDRRTGAKVAEWAGDPALHPHVNSCVARKGKLVCAASNFPKTPMLSRVEIFDAETLTLKRTIPLGRLPGSLTWLDWHDGAWWAGLANYDGRGGEPGRDHRTTLVARLDGKWRVTATWTYPDGILERIAPMSISGGAWGSDGRLYVIGHDRPEIYVLEAPRPGRPLRHVATIDVPIHGQAIAFDPAAAGVLFGIDRGNRAIVGMRLPGVAER